MFTTKPKERKVTPPSPSYMDSKQFAAYLAGLRNNRMNRPGGARPQPAGASRDSGRSSVGVRMSLDAAPLSETSSLHERNGVDLPSVPKSTGRPSLCASVTSRNSVTTLDRDYYPEQPVKPLRPDEVVPTARYIERGQRWMEKEEAVSLRQAMEDMDLRDQVKSIEDPEEKQLYEAALNEASELVWQHQNPAKLPQPGAPYRYKPHLRKNSYAYARTASAGMFGDDVTPTGLARDPTARSVSGSSNDSEGPGSVRSRASMSSSRRTSGLGDTGRDSLDGPRRSFESKKSYGAIASAGPSTAHGSHGRRSSLKRNISGEVQKPFSGDQIWEEPEGQTPEKGKVVWTSDSVQPLRVKPRNPLNRVQFASNSSDVADPSAPAPPPKPMSRYEIHRNPPSQSRNPQYTTNRRSESAASPDAISGEHGLEIRSDEIRQATSMSLKDRSAKLPTPSAVSNNPGRPIVSFDRNWKAPEEATDEKPEEPPYGRDGGGGGGGGSDSCRSPFVPRGIHSEQPGRQPPPRQQQVQVPAIAITTDSSASSPSTTPRRSHTSSSAISVDSHSVATSNSRSSVPTIAVSDAARPIPSIVLPEGPDEDNSTVAAIPIIVTPGDENDADTSVSSSRPLPTPQAATRTRRARPRSHWSPAPTPVGSRATARCHECGDPIEGRFVSLAGGTERFHPQCFTCYACGTSLEALEISPEPDVHRAARLARIAARSQGSILPEIPGETMAEDGDERLRFYCHLDWHEQFAPRCKHCTTPIIGEHVVALGSHWHYGHFFCAECGDPFGPGMTHIEKDGYAWCVACQTKRTERRAPKCSRCRRAVIGQYIQALGGEWHDECFRCASCGGGFDDGQIFPMEGRGTPGEIVVLCTICREKELKA